MDSSPKEESWTRSFSTVRYIIMTITFFGIMLYSFNKVVFLLKEMSQALGTGDGARLGTEWAEFPSRPTVAKIGNALGLVRAALQICSGKMAVSGLAQSKSAKQTGRPRPLGVMYCGSWEAVRTERGVNLQLCSLQYILEPLLEVRVPPRGSGLGQADRTSPRS